MHDRTIMFFQFYPCSPSVNARSKRSHNGVKVIAKCDSSISIDKGLFDGVIDFFSQYASYSVLFFIGVT